MVNKLSLQGGELTAKIDPTAFFAHLGGENVQICILRATETRT